MRLVPGPLVALALVFQIGTIAPRAGLAAEPDAIRIPRAGEAVSVTRDRSGVAHVSAITRRGLFFTQGYVHAFDRFFQMDVLRRQAAGRLAELLGRDALAGDAESRVTGARRAAERSLEALTPETRAALDAYADGVNAFLAAGDLPPEYAALRLTGASVEPWTALDSVAVVKLIAFDLSFDLDDIARTETLLAYREAGEERGFDGDALFFEDLNRSAPFAPAATVPDARLPRADGAPNASETIHHREITPDGAAGIRLSLRPGARNLARGYLDRAGRLYRPGRSTANGGGSNAWAIGGRRACGGRPILANDPHLDLTTPALFYPVRLAAAEGAFDAIGASIPGAPFVAFGHNRRASWGGVVNQFDLTDVYQEQIVSDPESPSGISTVHGGRREPVIAVPEVFRVNRLDDGRVDAIEVVPPGTSGVPTATLVVPRRNDGPIVSLDRSAGTAISVQYVGFGATRELDGFRLINGAGNLRDFRHALRFVDASGLSFVYADIGGAIAFLSSGAVPLREDLQAGEVRGAPPFLIRNGTGGNEWIGRRSGARPGDDRAPRFEAIPLEELPRIVNPPAGFLVTANNDPLGITLDNDPLNQLRPGGGILYLSPRFSIGIRAQRVTDLLRGLTAAGCATVEETKRIQADVVLGDAKVFTPSIIRAFRNAAASSAPPELAGCASDPRVSQAVARLRRWDFSAPTGIHEGFDADDDQGSLRPPTPGEVDASVAATIYSVWRGRMLRNTIDATVDELGVPQPVTQDLYMTALRKLLDDFARRGGVGRSGVDFFSLDRIQNRCRAREGTAGDPNSSLNPEARRDIFVLSSLVEGLDRLAGPAFANAFARSPRQQDYRWGKLHRVSLPHPLGGQFSINAVDRAFQPFGDELPGAPTDGGFETVDAASHSPRANAENDFVFDDGPVHRYVARLGRGPGEIDAEYGLSSGVSGVPGSPFFANLFRKWMTNEYFSLR